MFSLFDCFLAIISFFPYFFIELLDVLGSFSEIESEIDFVCFPYFRLDITWLKILKLQDD